MIFHENRLADDSHEISYLIFFRKFGKMLQNLPSAAVGIGALRVDSSCFCCSLLTIFKINFFKKSTRNSITVSNGLDPDQDQLSVGPDLGQNCLQRLSADDLSCH